jgi:hypothetical protein
VGYVSAELPEAVGEARDEKQVEIEDSDTFADFRCWAIA